MLSLRVNSILCTTKKILTKIFKFHFHQEDEIEKICETESDELSDKLNEDDEFNNFITNNTYYPDEEETITKATTLPKGWNWYDYDDGSGSLRNNDGAHYFSYDLAPYAPNGIEYKTTTESRWDIFWGSFEKFKLFAENQIKETLFKSDGNIESKNVECLENEENYNDINENDDDYIIVYFGEREVKMPKEDYLDIEAQKYGFNNYEDLKAHGYSLDI